MTDQRWQPSIEDIGRLSQYSNVDGLASFNTASTIINLVFLTFVISFA
jgi:hypothetical protein